MKIRFNFLPKLLPLITLVWGLAAQGQSISGVVNVYTGVVDITRCDGRITVQSAAGFGAGDKVLLIKMRGASVYTAPTDNSYGSISAMNNVGMTEFGKISSVAGNVIQLENGLMNDFGGATLGNVQLVKVKTGTSFTTSGTITADPWDGIKGGVVAISCCTLTLNHPITVNGQGFRGGPMWGSTITYPPLSCASTGRGYNFNNSGDGANKGEGIASNTAWGTVADPNGAGYGRWANAGGGGNNHNYGGGGGGNAGYGGMGGNRFSGCGTDHTYSGLGGQVLTGGIFMGGGGGAGHNNLYGATGGEGTAGERGGGIIIVEVSGQLINNSGMLSADGNSISKLATDDAAGGGGAGGTIYLYYGSFSGISPLVCTVHGGQGGSVNDPASSFGPGGGGSDGVILCTPTIASNLYTGLVQNLAGTDAKSSSNWGATNGGSRIVGSADFSFIPVGVIPFCKNYPAAPDYDQKDTVCEGQSLTICDTVPFGAILAEWDAQWDNPEYTVTFDTLVTEAPVCGLISFLPKIVICRTYYNITYSGSFDILYTLQNGCVCRRKIHVEVKKPEEHTLKVTINCGESIDLNDYLGCSDTMRGRGWLDSNHHVMLFGYTLVTPTSNTVYKQEFVNGSDTNACRACITRVEVTVNPLPPVTKTIYGCQGQPITISAGEIWQVGTTFEWILPGGTVYHDSGQAITRIANNGDEYIVNITYPSGCVRQMTITISTLAPITHNKSIEVICGDSLDLDTLDECGNNGLPWYNSTMGTWHPNGKVAVANTSTFTRNTYALSGTTYCLSCIMNITVNVLPMNPVTKTIYACENEQITLEAACKSGGGSWFWTGPGGTILPYNTSSINVTAHNGDIYIVGTMYSNGCYCVTTLVIQTTPVPTLSQNIDIYCGDSLDLDTLKRCNGYSPGWQNSSHVLLPSSKVYPGSSTVYYRESTPSPGSSCVNCREQINVNVLPRPADTVWLTLCANSDTTLDFPCSGGIEYHFMSPDIAQVLYPPVSPVSVSVGSSPVTYLLETVLPNGCVCSRIYIVRPLLPWGMERSVSVYCGDSLNLDSLAICSGMQVWINDSGDLLSSNRMKVTGSNTTRQYTGYTYNSSGCLICITKLTVNSLAQPVTEKSYVIDCRNDYIMIEPDCPGTEYLWYIHSTSKFKWLHGGSGAIAVGRSNTPQYFTVLTATADGCYCLSRITVTTMSANPTFHNLEAEIDCGEVLDLDDYNECDTVAGDTSSWIDNSTGMPVSSTLITGGGLVNGHTYSKKVEDEYGCLKCAVSVTIRVTQHFSYYDQPRYDVCEGAVVDPPVICAGGDHYEWYDDNLVLLGTTRGITAHIPMSGLFLRYVYDVNGCLICIERVHIVAYTPLTEDDVSAMPYHLVPIICPGQTCRQMTVNPSYDQHSGASVSCSWSPSGIVSDYGAGDILVCPPFTPGVYTRRCYNSDGCLISAYKVMIYIIPCMAPGKTSTPENTPHAGVTYSVYPNPTEGTFQVERSETTGNITVGIYDILGHLVSTNVMQDGEKALRFSLANYATGVYQVKITTASGEVLNYKLIRE